MIDKSHIIHIVCGPTASGKSAYALKLASETGGEIVNCDSLQIYDGLPILTAQPAPEDFNKVPHHLYATLHPNDVCSAGNWRELAEPVITGILARGKTPIICGGSGLYIKALMEGLSPIPDIPDDIRQAGMQLQKRLGQSAFHAELKKRDPVMADRFHPNHSARLLRAWEVLEATGISLAEWQKRPRLSPPENWTFNVHKIIPERSVLRKNCDDRLEKMIKAGALEEVEAFMRRLEEREVRPNVPLARALGFKHFEKLLRMQNTGGYDPHNYKQDLAEALSLAQAQTRQYAKRQTTWFRSQI